MGSILRFFKMQGCGNDYLFFPCFFDTPRDPAALARAVSDRHYGVGGDGAVFLFPSPVADVRMAMYNADGTRGMICGNALRCVGLWLFGRAGERRASFSVETDAGVRAVKVTREDGGLSVVCEMGRVTVDPRPLTLYAEGRTFVFHFVDAGNPHAVTFSECEGGFSPEKAAAALDRHPRVREEKNVEFARRLPDGSLSAVVRERGSGITLACGSGACAIAAAAASLGMVGYDTPLNVRMAGGVLTVFVQSDKFVRLCGDARFVYRGEVEWDEMSGELCADQGDVYLR